MSLAYLLQTICLATRFVAILFVCLASLPVEAEELLSVNLRHRTFHDDSWRVKTQTESWDPQQSAIIVCDMWNLHHCYNATQRVKQLAPEMNRVLQAARARGFTIIHAPSSCMAAYADHPARQRAESARKANDLPEGISEWCRWLTDEQPDAFPIDDSDGGIDDSPEVSRDWHEKLAAMGHTPGSPWTSQIDLLTIDSERDYITDSGVENWNILQELGIRNVIVMGVHTNMCVLGRPFGLRQLAQNGKRVVLMRDMTDTMYNPAQRPFVSHFTGTDLVVEHIEKYVCPTITSEALVAREAPFRFPEDHRKHLVMLIADDEYDTYRTLPKFALAHLGHDFQISYVHDDPDDINLLYALESIKQADLLLVSARRRMLSEAQMALLKSYVESGKPVVGIRMASHAFASRGQPADAGRRYWPEFDAEVLGGNYQGHHNNKNDDDPRTFVWVTPQAADHPIVRGLPQTERQVPSWLYKTSPLGPKATQLVTGRVAGRDQPEPVAWTNTNKYGGRVFYTSMGHPDDFDLPYFLQLFRNGIYWAAQLDAPPPLAGTMPLQRSGDIASQLVTAADKFLDRELAIANQDRAQRWKIETSSEEAHNRALAPRRKRLRHLLGLHDPATPQPDLLFTGSATYPARRAEAEQYEIFAVSWPVTGDILGRGLLLEPKSKSPAANIIALPHCDFTPDDFAGIESRLSPTAQYARRLAEANCRVFIPALVNRQIKVNGISNREWLHRAAYEMGRTLTGYEVAEIEALVNWIKNQPDSSEAELPLGLIGWGDGGLLATYAAAIDPRIDVTCALGSWGDLDSLSQQPVDRMLFSLLRDFGDVQLATMIAPRTLIVETGCEPVTEVPAGRGGGAPYRIAKPSIESLRALATQARQIVEPLAGAEWMPVIESPTSQPGCPDTLTQFLRSLSADLQLAAPGAPPVAQSPLPDPQLQQQALIHQFDRHTQAQLRDSHRVRQSRFWSKLDTSSLQAYEDSIAPFRAEFRQEIVGEFDYPLLPPRPRTRLIEQTSKWRRYEVVLDVWDGFFAYGLLTIPRDIAAGESRPAIVCQHGLEGRPQSVIGEKDRQYYHAFATELAEQGFVTFAPQNLYIFTDRFRTLQRKANTLGKTLFSLITPQHQQIVDWLQSLPQVDPDRVAFYGLSYGGKTAMRVPPLVTDYCLSICSADFNEWVDKNASTHNPRSYVNSGEYEIFEWNLGPTFNYAEMAALIAPRPFMVERGHFDGVSDDWTVGWEYARVRFLYAGLLKVPERTAIEWFAGPHSIHGVGTYEFLAKHLNWPQTP